MLLATDSGLHRPLKARCNGRGTKHVEHSAAEISTRTIAGRSFGLAGVGGYRDRLVGLYQKPTAENAEDLARKMARRRALQRLYRRPDHKPFPRRACGKDSISALSTASSTASAISSSRSATIGAASAGRIRSQLRGDHFVRARLFVLGYFIYYGFRLAELAQGQAFNSYGIKQQAATCILNDIWILLQKIF